MRDRTTTLRNVVQVIERIWKTGKAMLCDVRYVILHTTSLGTAHILLLQQCCRLHMIHIYEGHSVRWSRLWISYVICWDEEQGSNRHRCYVSTAVKRGWKITWNLFRKRGMSVCLMWTPRHLDLVMGSVFRHRSWWTYLLTCVKRKCVCKHIFIEGDLPLLVSRQSLTEEVMKLEDKW